MVNLSFVHIPKTAGTSVRAFLESHYTPDCVYPGYWIENDFSRRCGSPTLVRAHVPLQILAAAFPAHQTVTFLRRADQRALSHIQHVRRDRHHFFHDDFREMRVEQLIEIPRYRSFLSNMQTRFLGLSKEQVAGRTQQEIETIPVDELMFERAMKALYEIDFIGLSENIPASLAGLSARYFHGSEFDCDIRRNESDYHRDVGDLALLGDLNLYDSLLYESAVKRFRDGMRHDSSQGERLSFTQHTAKNIPSVRRVAGFGLYDLDSSRGLSYAFFGERDSASVEFSVLRDSWVAFAEIIYSETTEHFREFAMRFDGHQLALEAGILIDGRSVLAAHISPDLFHDAPEGMHQLEFRSGAGILREGYLVPQSVGLSAFGLMPAIRGDDPLSVVLAARRLVLRSDSAN